MKIKIRLSLLGMMITLILFVLSCTIKEEIPDKYTQSVLTSDPNLLINFLSPPLAQLRTLWWRQDFWGMQEATSDELFFPTRATDWQDGFVWQQDYLLTWSPTHRDVIGTWNSSNTGISASNTALANLKVESADDPGYIKAYRGQAKFLRTFYEYCLYDLFRKFPYRDAFSTNFLIPAKIFEGEAGFYHMVTIAKEQLPFITTREDAYYGQPNKDADLMLLAKLYLNKEIYTGIAGYDSCLIYLDELINSNHYGLADNYFKMFDVNNDVRYKTADDEAIFVAVNDDGDNYGNDDNVIWARPTLHYNQELSGHQYYPKQGTFWNGCACPTGSIVDTWFAGTDIQKDVRWCDSSYIKTMSIPAGHLMGQQYDLNKTPTQDRGGKLLNFTVKCDLIPSDSIEMRGVRVMKYMVKAIPINIHRTPNDFIIWRYADVLLMKAECLARANNDVAGALTIVNEIRTKRNAPLITASSKSEILDKILIERGLELYWEGHRRQDMIRFGTFLLPKTSKPTTSDATKILLPIPAAAISGSSGTLSQNPGY